MSDEPNYDEDMKLPPGKTCADCFASRFCVGIGCTTPERTTCDYWPNRFRERRSSGIEAAGRVPQPNVTEDANKSSIPLLPARET